MITCIGNMTRNPNATEGKMTSAVLIVDDTDADQRREETEHSCLQIEKKKKMLKKLRRTTTDVNG